MEVCYEVCLEKDRTSAMNIVVVFATDSVAFSVKSSSYDSEKQNGKPILVCEHCKKPWHTKDNCWKLHGQLPYGKNN